MSRAPKSLRYTVDGSEKSYTDKGPAISLSITLALALPEPGTVYARDAVTDKIVGYTEVISVRPLDVRTVVT